MSVATRRSKIDVGMDLYVLLRIYHLERYDESAVA